MFACYIERQSKKEPEEGAKMRFLAVCPAPSAVSGPKGHGKVCLAPSAVRGPA